MFRRLRHLIPWAIPLSIPLMMLTAPWLPWRGERVVETRIPATGESAALVFFGFVNCPKACPEALGVLAKLHREGPLPPVYFVSLAPGVSDEVVSAYAAGFDPGFSGRGFSESELSRELAAFGLPGERTAHRAALHFLKVGSDGRWRLVQSFPRVPGHESDILAALAP